MKKNKTMKITGIKGNISLLINSVLYFLSTAFIQCIGNDEYRLVVIHNSRVLTDCSYPTIQGAKIAFSKLYSRKAWKEGIKGDWSHFYDPDKNWLEEKIPLT